MKISLNKVRAIIREVLSEAPYMRPHHMRGVGPDVQTDVRDGKISAEQALVMFPKAINSLQDFTMSFMSPDDMMDIFQTENPYPKDVVDTWILRLEDGRLFATSDITPIEASWDGSKWNEMF